MINYLNGSNKKYLTLSDNYLKVITWYVNTSFTVYPYFKIRIRAIMTMGQGAMQSVSSK